MEKSAIIDELRTMLMRELPETREQISREFANNEIEQLLETVHRLHGATSYCKLDGLKQACFNVETALKGDQEGLEGLVDSLLSEINQILIN